MDRYVKVPMYLFWTFSQYRQTDGSMDKQIIVQDFSFDEWTF